MFMNNNEFLIPGRMFKMTSSINICKLFHLVLYFKVKLSSTYKMLYIKYNAVGFSSTKLFLKESPFLFVMQCP